MLDLSSLPISGGVILAGIAWAGISALALGPLVADRTIETSDWQQSCERKIQISIARQAPSVSTSPDISCRNVSQMMGSALSDFCQQGGDVLFELLTIDPLAGQKQHLRRQEQERLDRLAEQAPSRCSCASMVVSQDLITWGLYAGSARLLGGPDDLNADLHHALRSERCAKLGEEKS